MLAYLLDRVMMLSPLLLRTVFHQYYSRLLW